MSAVRISSAAKVSTLDGRAQPDEVVTEADVQEPPKLARLLARLLKDTAALKRAFAPRRIDFEDVAVSTAGATVSLQHNFAGRVRWYLVGWSSTGTQAPILKEAAATTASTLVLASYVAGTATLRVESAG